MTITPNHGSSRITRSRSGCWRWVCAVPTGELAAFHFGTPPDGSRYLVLGHECLGEVVEVGDRVAGVRPGDLVIPEVRRPCLAVQCRPCRMGRADHCGTHEYRESGILRKHGFLSGFVVEQEQFLDKVPADLRSVAVLTEPLTIAEKALDELQPLLDRLPWAGHNAVVLGAGPIGLLGAMALRTRGFDVSVYSYADGCPARAEIVRAIGARFIDAEECGIDEMVSQTGPIDLIYEAAGSSDLTFALIPKLGPNGIFVIVGAGNTPHTLELDANRLLLNVIRNNQVLMGTVNASKANFAAAIQDLQVFRQRWPEALERVISGRFSLADAIGAVTGRAGIKNIVEVTV